MTSPLGSIAKSLSLDERELLLNGRWPPRQIPGKAGARGNSVANPMGGLIDKGLAHPMGVQLADDFGPDDFRTDLGVDLRNYVQRRIKEGYVEPWS